MKNAARLQKRTGRPFQKPSGKLPEIIGVIHREAKKTYVLPAEKKFLEQRYLVAASKTNALLQDGEIVSFSFLQRGDRLQKRAIVTKTLSPLIETQAYDLSIYQNNLPYAFSEEALKEVDQITSIDKPNSQRKDLRHVPFVTVDPPDASENDDAIYAEPLDTPQNPGGSLIYVAIADVSAYLLPQSALDRDALKRGNSVYFPNAVIPMLPKRLSHLCTLIPDVDRPALTLRIEINAQGVPLNFTLCRSLIRCALNMTYAQMQTFREAPENEGFAAHSRTLQHIWQAYDALRHARDKRAALNVSLPERKLGFDLHGNVDDVLSIASLESNHLIEAYMILANTIIATALAQKGVPTLYRVHEPPPPDKIVVLREELEAIGLRLKDAPRQTDAFHELLESVKGTEKEQSVQKLLLRAQSQAFYTPEKKGHFGLNLENYTHFTSPIRRYADVIAHRAALCLIETDAPMLLSEKLSVIAYNLSEYEKRAVTAERNATDRLIAAFIEPREGETFQAQITGTSRFLIFVSALPLRVEGVVRIRSLPGFFQAFEEGRLLLNKQNRGYKIGDLVSVRLRKADPVSGGLDFEMLSAPYEQKTLKKKPVSHARKKKGARA